MLKPAVRWINGLSLGEDRLRQFNDRPRPTLERERAVRRSLLQHHLCTGVIGTVRQRAVEGCAKWAA